MDIDDFLQSPSPFILIVSKQLLTDKFWFCGRTIFQIQSKVKPVSTFYQ